MHFSLFSIYFLFVLTTFVHSAPTAPLDTTTLLNNAQQAQQLNAQFRSAKGTATGPCNSGDTTCVQGAIASCVNGQFDTSTGRCPATEHCFALPSVNSNGTTIACTSEKSAQSLINAAGATGDVTGSASGGSTNSINSTSVSSTLSGATPGPTAAETAVSIDADYNTITTTVFASTPIPTASQQSIVTVTVTLIPLNPTTLPSMITTTLPSVTETLSPEEAASVLSSLLGQGGLTTELPETVSSTVFAAATATLISVSNPSVEVLSSTVSASATNIPLFISHSSSAVTPTATADNTGNIPSAVTPVAIANNTGSSINPGYGGYSGY